MAQLARDDSSWENQFGLQALTFDVFGTVVDWRTSIIREGEALGRVRGFGIDWPEFADAWRRLYRPTIERVTAGEQPWADFDALQRLMLEQVLDQLGVTALTDEDRAHLSRVWRRLDAWPDSSPGLTRLKQRLIVSTLSNGSVRQLVDLARHAGLPWDLVLSVELFHAYKPDPRVYRGAVQLLQVPPGAIMMVAAHVYDLRAARAEGMRTAFVRRPREWGADAGAEQAEPGEFDLEVDDLEDLALRLGC